MSPTFITKRPHKKSRAGCITCKARKIKCDEVQPACTFCAMRKISCVYPPRPARSAPASSEDQEGLVTRRSSSSSPSDEDEDSPMSLQIINPTPIVMTSSGSLSKTEMRLMYQWSTFTYNSVGVGEAINKVLRFVVPELAFENEFLLNGLLGVASLHQQRLLPHIRDAQKQTDLYRFKALSSFRKAVATIGPNSPSYEAALVMSVLLVVLCSQDYEAEDGQLTVVRWIVLYRGLYAIISMTTMPTLDVISVGPVFRRKITELTSVPVVPTILMNMLATIHPLDSDYKELPYYCGILDALGMLYASLREDGISANLSIRIVSWPSFGSDEFAKLARESQPRALVILAYYLIFVKLVEGLWWLEGISDKEIKAISKMVGPKYATYMEIPLQAAEMTNLEAIASLILR